MSYNTTQLGNVTNDKETRVNNFLTDVYYPIKVNEKLVLLTGGTFESTTTEKDQFFPNEGLTMARLNFGMKYNFSQKWAGTYVLLPKIASDFGEITSRDFQIGGIAIMDYKMRDNLILKFGAYSSSENFGVGLTPIVGIWYRSKNEKFYINANLPIRMDINYAFTNNFSLGTDLLTSIKSYDMNQNQYVQEESIRFALYAAYGLMNNKILIRGKVGLDTTDYGIYNQGDKVGLQVLTLPVQEDKRKRLNSEFTAAPYIGMDLIYRFDLKKQKQ